nr:putative disease resistance protein [Quercus suber]
MSSRSSNISWNILFPFAVWTLWLHRNCIAFDNPDLHKDLKLETLAKASKFLYLGMIEKQNRVKTPDFTRVPNLEKIYLRGCTNLIEVHSSVAILKRLIFMDLKDCIRLRSLPSRIETEYLEILIISGCSNVKVIPDFAENMQRLHKLYLNGTAIEKLSSSMEHLTGLMVLDLSHCKNLLYLSRTIIRLEYLREFVVSGCSKLAKFEDHEIASTHEPEIEIISSKTPESSHAHETKDAEISSGAETESVFSQIKGESQLSKLTVHVKEPMEPATPLAVSTSSTNKGATVEPFLSESSKFFVLPDPETKPISLEKPELLSAHGTSKQTAVEPISASPVMGADREVQMEGLLPEEAWKLFREQVGGIIESPNIQQFARAIVQKCYGFPLLIIVTGRALAKENDTLAWMHASKEFSECSAHGIYGHEALIQKLKFSYDRLEGPDVKSCFLYCALFPEDQEINIDKLVDYWIQEGLVAGNWPDSYKRGSDIVEYSSRSLSFAERASWTFHQNA